MDRRKNGVDWDCQDSEKVEAAVLARPRNHGGRGDPGAEGQGKSTTKNMLGWGNEIKVGDIGFSVFGTGLRRCDSA
jgi:hypothetical protein